MEPIPTLDLLLRMTTPKAAPPSYLSHRRARPYQGHSSLTTSGRERKVHKLHNTLDPLLTGVRRRDGGNTVGPDWYTLQGRPP
jgi:hypothetical protein